MNRKSFYETNMLKGAIFYFLNSVRKYQTDQIQQLFPALHPNSVFEALLHQQSGDIIVILRKEGPSEYKVSILLFKMLIAEPSYWFPHWEITIDEWESLKMLQEPIRNFLVEGKGIKELGFKFIKDEKAETEFKAGDLLIAPKDWDEFFVKEFLSKKLKEVNRIPDQTKFKLYKLIGKKEEEIALYDLLEEDWGTNRKKLNVSYHIHPNIQNAVLSKKKISISLKELMQLTLLFVEQGIKISSEKEQSHKFNYVG